MNFKQQILSCGTLGVLFGVSSSALAGSWNEEPQPLIFEKPLAPGKHQGGSELVPILSDAGSPLAWDPSAHMLWFVDGGELHAAWWTGFTFKSADMGLIQPMPEAGLAVDSGTHFVYCTDSNGLPHCARLLDKKWVVQKIGDDPIAKLLAVDSVHHRLFAYDANAAGIRLYQFDAKTKSWPSSIIVSGLGAAGDLGAFDNGSQTLYTTHETAEPGIPRHPSAQTVDDPSGSGKLKPWPLVATLWDGKTWSSRVLSETGVPQQPAVRPLDHRLFFAMRDETSTVHFYQPAYRKAAKAFGSETGWQGQDTWQDSNNYKIVKHKYPKDWHWSSLSFTSVDFLHLKISQVGWYRYTIKLAAPVVPIPYYAPVWTDVALAPRLASFRALINPKQGRLVQHRKRFEGEIARSQIGMQLAGYVYKDANGVLAAMCAADPATLQASAYPILGSEFDPLSPPVDFAKLSEPGVEIFADPDDIVADPTRRNAATSTAIPSWYATNAASPFVSPHLRLPKAVQLKTFGHRYLSKALDQPGGRFRSYSNYGTDYAMASHIAVDAATGVTFYTQSPPPVLNENTAIAAAPQNTLPLTGFADVPDPKLPRPQGVRTWIVMVY